MFAIVSALLGGCRHRNYSFPLTPKSGVRPPAASATGCYVVCLDCGKELAYDWNEMKVIASRPAASGSANIIAKLIKSYAGSARP
jgi:hypothetical protein